MKTKTFDCIAMKDRIQAELLREWEGLSDAEIRIRIQHDLETSDTPVARWWRRIAKRDKEQ